MLFAFAKRDVTKTRLRSSPSVVKYLPSFNAMLSVATNPLINTLRPRQNGRHVADDTFNRIFVNTNVRISFKFPLKFVPKGPINNIPALVQIMAWRLPGDKPFSELVMVSLLTYICVTRPQWVKAERHIYASVNLPSLVHLNQCLDIVNLSHKNKLQCNINPNTYSFIQENAYELSYAK